MCRDCQATAPDRLPIDPRLLRLAEQLLTLPRVNAIAMRLARLTRHQSDPLNRVLSEQIQHTLGRGLRMPRIILAGNSESRNQN